MVTRVGHGYRDGVAGLLAKTILAANGEDMLTRLQRERIDEVGDPAGPLGGKGAYPSTSDIWGRCQEHIIQGVPLPSVTTF